MTQEEYLALTSMARAGAVSPDQARALEVFLRSIDGRNHLTRYALVVQWQELDSPVPPTARFPDKWPPELRATIERTDRAIARIDVEAVLRDRARRPTNVMVTRDLGGIAGWTKLEDFFTA